MRGRAETNVAFCFQHTVQSLLFPCLPYTKNSLWKLRGLSLQSFITFSLVVFIKSICNESKQSFPFILPPLPPIIFEALKKEPARTLTCLMDPTYFQPRIKYLPLQCNHP